MPPLYNTMPGKEYENSQSEILAWVRNQYPLLSYVFSHMKNAGYVVYDKDTGKWKGVDYHDE